MTYILAGVTSKTESKVFTVIVNGDHTRAVTGLPSMSTGPFAAAAGFYPDQALDAAERLAEANPGDGWHVRQALFHDGLLFALLKEQS